jgi:phosphohistidine swiveling domain-containing protein
MHAQRKAAGIIASVSKMASSIVVEGGGLTHNLAVASLETAEKRMMGLSTAMESLRPK